MFFWDEGPRSSGVGGYFFGGPVKTIVPTPLKNRGPEAILSLEAQPK
jgi:hypothetical protein